MEGCHKINLEFISLCIEPRYEQKNNYIYLLDRKKFRIIDLNLYNTKISIMNILF